TSGTAAANFLHAIAEAKLSRAPIVVVTADRTPEARAFGGAQDTAQVAVFGSHVKWFQDMPVASGLDSLVRYSRRVGARASDTAKTSPQGPTHVNFSFREPLISDSPLVQSGEGRSSGIVEVVGTTSRAEETDVRRVAARLRS